MRGPDWLIIVQVVYLEISSQHNNNNKNNYLNFLKFFQNYTRLKKVVRVQKKKEKIVRTKKDFGPIFLNGNQTPNNFILEYKSGKTTFLFL